MTIEYFRLGKTKFNKFKQTLSNGQLQNTDLLVEGAYAIQDKVNSIRKQRGDKQIGYKVGCISETIQNSLGIYQPIFGRLYASERLDSGVTLPLSRFDGLAIEGELAVKLRYSIAELKDREFALCDVIESVFPVIELHHYPDEEPLTAPSMISQNAIHAGFVQSDKFETPEQLPNEVAIKINDVDVARVNGAINRQTISDSLIWLSNQLQAEEFSICSNLTILCGSVAPLFPIRNASHIQVNSDTGAFAEITIRLK